ncbi:MAG: bifunctional methylenetetrahydrofolate dehydrogenase/methenyltetrahydrofolate cyclohydrolase FolD [Betaproteobacteria bacterium]
MVAKVIDGKALAAKVRVQCQARTQALVASGVTPGLAVILVGENPASKVYVGNKAKACAEVGIASEVIRLPGSSTEDEVIDQIRRLNGDGRVHGILVQLPLPAGMDIRRVLGAISHEKDVDGFHLYNVGALVVGETIFPPCTPYGVQLLLESESIPVAGQNVVIVGASNIVGKPMALMLMRQDATVTVCHAKTRDLGQFTILADILIVAVGHPKLIVGSMIKTGAVVIDVGINRLPDGTLTGDVDFDSAARKASYITPVPGGVGPMTVTMLIVNTLNSTEHAMARAARAATAPSCEVQQAWEMDDVTP